MQKPVLKISVMTRQEVDIAIDWAATEGWNPGLHDADCFYAADPNGFLIGRLGNEIIAVISAVKYGDAFGFLGFYMVKPAYRDQGYGIQLWDAALAYLKGRTIGLDGVLAQQANYQKSGFTLAYRNIRYQGCGGGHGQSTPGIIPLSAIHFDELCAYDKRFFPDNRVPFLRCWIDQPGHTALGILSRRKLAAYGVMRICRTGYKIGPLFADNPAFAEQLFSALTAQAPAGAPVFLDTPAVNLAAIDLAKRHNMTVSFETVRMYKGKFPDFPLNQLFGVTSFELG
ncbi:MAG: GNAT family N-acetyltransferase [Gallionella sp.]|jgi:GNAT superfamily N-acetyltransferase